MAKNSRHIWGKVTGLGAAIMLCTACANMGSGPNGGPADRRAPQYMGSTPKPNQVDFKDKKITIQFDEYITLKDPYSKITVSPAQKMQPSISGLGKKVTIELADTMLENRTYIIDFSDAIVDNNEGNPIEDFNLTFSTGKEIDTMAVSGIVIDAQTLLPQEGVWVGAYEEGTTEAFRTKALEYICRTNHQGKFTLRGLKNRAYTLYALKDGNGDYHYDNKNESIALPLANIVPTYKQIERRDTVMKDSVTIDTIKVSKVGSFGPDTLVFKMFKEEKHLQYYKNATWNEKDKIVLNLVNEKKAKPTITPINFNEKDWYQLETGVTFDTLTYWITNPEIMEKDTLEFAIDFEKTDSMEQFRPHRDTIRLYAKKWKKISKKDAGPNASMRSTIEVYNKPEISWDKPLKKFDKSNCRILVKEDTVWTDILDYEVLPIDGDPRRYKIDMAMEEGKEYRLRVDTSAVEDYLGRKNREKEETSFHLRKKTEYTSLLIETKNAKMPAFIELMSGADKIVRKEKVGSNGRVKFENLSAGNYFIRLTEDANEDGEWTTGELSKQKTPENVIYYPKKITLKANWDREEEWDVTSTPLQEQLPAELRKSTTTNKK